MLLKKIKIFLEKNQNIFESLAALVTVLGIGFVGFEYYMQHKNNQNAKVSKVFELYKEYNRATFMKSRNSLTEAYLKVRQNNQGYYKDFKDYITTMEDFWESEYIEIINLANFFDQLFVCVDNELCDKNYARVLFGQEAQDFLEMNYQFFCLERERYQNQNLGIRLESFVEEQKQNHHQKTRNCDHIQEYLEGEVTKNTVVQVKET